ncbi:LysR family transcriptional regulator [Halomonas sp. YLGW01]|uniref:LysR family transcriptional regulator n=1 Tax=Halomonas sp. YLGW01 TaxID=2773308 RepID=UPI00177D50A2|nr:LysR family transcriptional regulator [Halomonas sp. YLGW01]
MVDESETSGTPQLGGALEDIRAFCTVVELGSISAAARELGETKGGVSRRISRLEGRLGAALLARTPRAVSATEEGMLFQAKARDALALLADATEGARLSRSVPQGLLRVTAPVDMGIDLLPPLVVAFQRRHPQIRIELLPTDTKLDLAANRIDLALRASADDLPDMNYRASRLADFQMCLYAAPDYLASHGHPGAPEALPEHALAICRALEGAAPLVLTDRRGRRSEIHAQPGLRTTDYSSLARLLAAGGGIGVLPDRIARPLLEAGRLARVLPEHHLAEGRLYAITLAGLEAPARVRVFRDFLREALNG